MFTEEERNATFKEYIDKHSGIRSFYDALERDLLSIMNRNREFVKLTRDKNRFKCFMEFCNEQEKREFDKLLEKYNDLTFNYTGTDDNLYNIAMSMNSLYLRLYFGFISPL